MHTTPALLHETPREDAPSEPRFGCAGFYSAPKNRDFPSHQHTHWEWVYYRTGQPRAVIGEQEFEARPGTMLLTPPHTAHHDIALTAYEVIYIAVDAPPDMTWPMVCHDDSEYSMARICAALVRENDSHFSTRDEMLALLMRQLMLIIERGEETRKLSQAERIVRQAEQLIEERHTQAVSQAEIARALGVSPSYLREQFGKQRGQSPRRFLQQSRLRHALSLLHHSTLTLEHIARICGYHSASHLSRHIKNETRHTPGALRVLDSQPISVKSD